MQSLIQTVNTNNKIAETSISFFNHKVAQTSNYSFTQSTRICKFYTFAGYFM